LNYDEQCRDAYYSRQQCLRIPHASTSQAGYNGLFNPDANGASDNFLYHGKVMVWSAGPDRMVIPIRRRNQGVQQGQYPELAVVFLGVWQKVPQSSYERDSGSVSKLRCKWPAKILPLVSATKAAKQIARREQVGRK